MNRAHKQRNQEQRGCFCAKGSPCPSLPGAGTTGRLRIPRVPWPRKLPLCWHSQGKEGPSPPQNHLQIASVCSDKHWGKKIHAFFFPLAPMCLLPSTLGRRLSHRAPFLTVCFPTGDSFSSFSGAVLPRAAQTLPLNLALLSSAQPYPPTVGWRAILLV